jgi:predicted enzyme related to lactoylglutathione lyase
MTTRLRKTGEFCWFNILTPRPANAREFFGELLGWTYLDTGMGHTVQVDGHDVGAIFDLAGPNTPKGTPPLIGLMVKVQSADAAAERVRALRGEANPPFDIGGAGRMSVCHDPNGAEFDVWEPRALQGTDVDANAPGAPTWFETMTTDVDRATKFYSALFGWRSGSGSDHRTFTYGGRRVGGAKRCSLEGQRPHWATYFAVKDADKIARDAIKRGAEVFASVTAVRGIRSCGIRSPQGIPFYVMERGD